MGKKWPAPMNLPFFAVAAYVPGEVQNQAEKKSKNAFRPVPIQKSTFAEVCSWDGPQLPLRKIGRKAGFVPGTKCVCPRDKP